MKPNILINALSALQGGGQTYLINILNESHKLPFTVVVLVSSANKKIFNKIPGIELFDIGWWGKSVLRRTVWETFVLPFLLKKNNFRVLISPGGIVPLSLFRSDTLKLVSVCQNMLPFLPEQIKNAETLKFKLKLIILFLVQSISFKKSDLVIFLSDYAKNHVTNKVSFKGQSVIIPHGLSDLFWKKRDPISEDYVLYVSSFYSYKCQSFLVEAWGNLKKKYPNLKTKLYLAGDCTTSYGMQVQELVYKLKLEDSVHFLGSIPYEEMAKYTQSSKLNIFASTCENCPNILLEYLASQRPILCSEIDPMPEFAGDSVIYFNPENVNEILIKLENIIFNEHLDLDKMANSAFERSLNYSWNTTRKKTWYAIESLLK